ncbi:MAG TPA: ABC transporter permease, partial [Vicinamibacterales bacterium]|nr:ABC transporter permease [Vicinamibacterales bacterium]
MLDQLLNDVRFGIRTLAKNRAFALLAIVTLGLGIGANTAIFSVIYGVLLKPLPYADSDRLVLIRQSAPPLGRDDVSVSIKEFFTYRDTAADFDGLVEFHQMNFDLLRRGEPDRVSTGVVSPNFFNVLGIAPILGRTFVADDDKPGAPAVLVLSYSYWQKKFGGDRAIVGQVFEMNDRPHTVVGVLPNVPHYPQENDVYMPSSACPFRAAAEQRIHQNARAFAALNVFGKLKPEISRERAAADVDVICRRFAADDKAAYRPGSGFTATTLGVRDEMTRNARPMLLILLGTTGLVLLIACANVANLTLARLLRRDRELSVRSALGAGRGRLVRQLLTESTLLSLAGGAFGLLFAAWTVGLLTTFVERFTARTGEVAIDLRVLLFTAAVSIVTGVVFGTLPATTSRMDLAGAMKQGGKGTSGGGRQRIQGALIVVQVAVSVVLLIGAGLLLTSFYRLQSVDPGYKADRVMSAELFTSNFTKYPDVEAQRRFYVQLVERLESQAGVLSAAITNAVPLRTAQPFSNAFQIEGRVVDDPNKRPTADARIVSAGFFKTLGVPLVRGRAFTDGDDRETQRVVVVNKAMMRYWDGADPIGSRISLDNGQSWATIVGIVGDVKQFGLDKPAVAQVYTPLRQTPQGLGGLLLLRTSSDRAAATALIRDAVWAIDPDLPVMRVRTLDDIRDQYLATPRLTAMLLTIFAALALLVTVAGITG